MNRIDRIYNKIKTENAEKLSKAEAETLKVNRELDNIKLLTDRITELLNVANCLINNSRFPSDPYKTNVYYGTTRWGFVADGFYHRLGFMGHISMEGRNTHYLGYYRGGACGPWDFFTNGKETFLRHEKSEQKKTPSSAELIKFQNDFEEFEAAFYNWFDSVYGE